VNEEALAQWGLLRQKQTNLYRPKFLLIIFCYSANSWAPQLIRGVFHLDISFICWFRGIMVPYCFLESLHILSGMLKDKENVDHESM